MLQGYFDDSGSEPKSFAFVVAGYILEAEKMADFADDWSAELDKSPKIEYFKMAEAYSGTSDGPFLGMRSELRKAKTRSLLAVINKHKPVGIASFFNWEDFKFYGRYLPEGLGDPYHPLFFLTIDNVLNYQKAAGIFPQKIQLDFDHQGKAGLSAIEWYGKLMGDDSPFAKFQNDQRAILEGTPRMLDDKKYVPLQAADMLAWVTRNSGTPGIDITGWEWLYAGIAKTSWGGSQGFARRVFHDGADLDRELAFRVTGRTPQTVY